MLCNTLYSQIFISRNFYPTRSRLIGVIGRRFLSFKKEIEKAEGSKGATGKGTKGAKSKSDTAMIQVRLLPFLLSLPLSSLESMSLEYEPFSEPLRDYAD
jgi:hypothetical protein